MRTFIYCTLILMGLAASVPCFGQFGKLKAMVSVKKDTTKQNSEKKQKGPGLMSKFVTKIAKSAGGMMNVTTTADLSTVVPNIYMTTNLCPYEVGTAEMAFYEGWKAGGNFVAIMFTNRNGSGVNKIDGNVLINGIEAKYVTTGVYVAFGADNASDKTVDITTRTGNRSSFKLPAPKHAIALKTINGKKENIQLDLTKDVTLELENPAGTEGTNVLVKIVAKTVGIKAFYDVGYFPTADKITVPAAAFRNLNMNPGNKSFMNFKESFLVVERSYVDQAIGEEGAFENVEFANIYNDGKFIAVTKEPELNTGFTVEGNIKGSSGQVTYTAFKPNAFLSRCLSSIETIGIKSFAIRGTTYVSQTSTENRTGSDGSIEQIRTTLSAQFPQMSDDVWDHVLEEFYGSTIPVLTADLAATTAPIETITSSPSYQAIAPYSKDDENTSVQFSRAYKDTKLFSAFLPISEGYGLSPADNRIMNESHTNALLTVTIDLQMSLEAGTTVMKPLLAFTLQGQSNGFAAATKYLTINVTGAPYKLKRNQKITGDVLESILQRDDLITALHQAIGQLVTKENENADYRTLWNCR